MIKTFERFTDRARRVVVLAQEAARNNSQNYIGQEHILWGLAHEAEGIGAKVLEKLGLTDEMIDTFIDGLIKTEVPSGHIPFTPDGKKVLELALREALQLGHNYIGTEHVLLGLCRQGANEGVKALLKEHNIDLGRVRSEIIQMLADYVKPQADKPKPTALAMPQHVMDVVKEVQHHITTTDNTAYKATLQLELDAFMSGWERKIPTGWESFEAAAKSKDPDYEKYLELKLKFE